jgi:hypothetical protein
MELEDTSFSLPTFFHMIFILLFGCIVKLQVCVVGNLLWFYGSGNSMTAKQKFAYVFTVFSASKLKSAKYTNKESLSYFD